MTTSTYTGRSNYVKVSNSTALLDELRKFNIGCQYDNDASSLNHGKVCFTAEDGFNTCSTNDPTGETIEFDPAMKTMMNQALILGSGIFQR